MVVKNSHLVHGAKKPFRLEINDNQMQLALLNLVIDSKLCSCELFRMKVGDILLIPLSLFIICGHSL